MSMCLSVRVRSIAIAFAVIANGVALAQVPPTPPGTPKRVRVVFDEQQIKDPQRARVYQLIVDSVPEPAWPTIQVTQTTKIAALLNEYFDIYTIGPGRSPETQRLLAAMVADANPTLVLTTARDEVTAGSVRLPPVPVRAYSSYQTGEVVTRTFDPESMSYLLRAPGGEETSPSADTIPKAANGAVRRGALTEVLLSVTPDVKDRLRRYRSLLRPLLALDEDKDDLVNVTLLGGAAAPCNMASAWLAGSPYHASLKAALSLAEIAKIETAAANLPLTIIDWNVTDPKGHGAKVRAVVTEVLNHLGLGSLDSRVRTVELNPTRNRDGLKKLLATYKQYITQQSGGADIAKVFDSAEKWVAHYVSPDEYALNQRVPTLLLQAIFWSNFAKPQTLNFSFTTDSVALTVLDANFMLGAKAFGALAAGNSGMPASPALRPQAEAYQWDNIVNVTHGRSDGTIDGDTTNSQYKIIVSLIAPGCGYTTPPLVPEDIGSSFASPYVAAVAWIRMLQGTQARSVKRALINASEPSSAVGQRVESGGLFDPALFLLQPNTHAVSAQGAYLSLSSLAFTMTYTYEGSELTINNSAIADPTYVVSFGPCPGTTAVCTIVRRWLTGGGLFLTAGPVKSVAFDAKSGQQRFETTDPAALLKLVRFITF